VKTLPAAIDLTNQLAPEHCEVMTRNARKVAERIVTRRRDFSRSVFADGPSAITWPDRAIACRPAAPGASFAGLTVDQFQRRTSMVEYDLRALKKSLPALSKFAEIEGLDAHGPIGFGAGSK